MATVDHAGVRIHYRVDGSGPPLVLHHGFSTSLEYWQQHGYMDALSRRFRVVRFDARGHGESDKPHDAKDYELRRRVLDVVAVLDDLEIERAHFFGFSMGGRVGFGIAQHARARFSSLVIGAIHPYGANYDAVDARARSLATGMEAYVATLEAQTGALPPGRRAELLACDAKALHAMSLEFRDAPSLEAALPLMTMPCLLFAGDADPYHHGAARCAETLPNASFVSLPGLGHRDSGARSDLIVPLLVRFLGDLESRST